MFNLLKILFDLDLNFLNVITLILVVPAKYDQMYGVLLPKFVVFIMPQSNQGERQPMTGFLKMGFRLPKGGSDFINGVRLP